MSEQLIQTPCAFGDNGNFLLERELGSGGMGGVYMGRDKMLDRPVAVKVMQREFGADAEFVEKFKREAQSAAKLIHPNIAQVYSYGICDGMPYIAMELAAGGSLYSIMNANPGKTDVARVIKICQQVAQALQCASDQGFVHGDVKPENILLDSNGNAKLVDFGLAAMQKDTDEIWGTPYYISPEKVRKEPVDFRADMYSLGGTLYHALTGVAPFEGDDSIAVVKKRFEGQPKKPSEIRPELSTAIDNLVMTMLALAKEERYPSFEALIDAFKAVLTTGLTAKLPTTVAAPKKTTVGGVRRMTAVRGRRTAMMKRPGTTVKKKLEGEEGDEGALDETEKPETDEDEEEEGGGNLGLKVIGVVVGAILLIGGVIGGLVWYQIADKKARAAEEQAQIVAGIGKARGAISDTLSSAAKFADEFDAFAARAAEECQKPTDELKKILPEEQGGQLKPGPSKELQDAIAATNEVPKDAGAQTSATNAPSAATTNAAPAAVAAAKPIAKLPQFRPPTEAESDPASPEGEKYLQEKKTWEAEQLKKAQKPAAEAQPKPETAPVAPKADEKKSGAASEVVITMNELWDRAYGCQACAIRIRHAVRKIQAKGAEAENLKEETRENMDKLAELSRALVDMLDQVKTSKDVENVRKGITYIKSRGEKTVEQTVKRLRIEKLEADRKAKAEAAAAAEKERQEKLAEEKKAKVEEEEEAIKSKFEALAALGLFRQLDWKGAIRQLEDVKSQFKTSEGQLAADLEIRKVNAMKKAQDVVMKGLRTYTFKKKGKLKDAKVVSVNETEIAMERGKSKLKITWQRFYREQFAYVKEVMGYFIFKGRQNSGLSQRDVADAMTGASLLISIVCGEEAESADIAEKLAQESVKQFPDYLKTAQKIFPDMKFEGTEE